MEVTGVNERDRGTMPPMTRDLIRAGLVGVGSLFLIWLGLHCAAHSEATAVLLGLPKWPSADRIYWVGLSVALCVGGLASFWFIRSVIRLCRDAPWFGRQGRAEAGTIMVEFALVFPFLGLAMGLTIQSALIANATLVVRYAAFSAARSAIVRTEYSNIVNPFESLFDEAEAKRAAELVLGSISPDAGGVGDDDAKAILSIFQKQDGPWGSKTYPGRVNYAEAATTVTLDGSPANLIPDLPEDLIPPLSNVIFSTPAQPNFAPQISGHLVSPMTVTATVDFQLLCVIPGLPDWIGLVNPAPGGVSGSAFTITQSARLQSPGARQSGLASVVPLFGNTPLPD